MNPGGREFSVTTPRENSLTLDISINPSTAHRDRRQRAAQFLPHSPLRYQLLRELDLQSVAQPRRRTAQWSSSQLSLSCAAGSCDGVSRGGDCVRPEARNELRRPEPEFHLDNCGLSGGG